MRAGYEPVGEGVWAIDTLLLRPRMDASHLILADGRAAFVDVGTSRSAPHLLNALGAIGVDREAVEYIFLTHIHLDHAGAAWYFAQQGATIYVHPSGLKHLIDPTKLYNSAKIIYKDKTKLIKLFLLV